VTDGQNRPTISRPSIEYFIDQLEHNIEYTYTYIGVSKRLAANVGR